MLLPPHLWQLLLMAVFWLMLVQSWLRYRENHSWVEAWTVVQPLIPQEQSRDWNGYTEAEIPLFSPSQPPNPHCHCTIQLCPILWWIFDGKGFTVRVPQILCICYFFFPYTSTQNLLVLKTAMSLWILIWTEELCHGKPTEITRKHVYMTYLSSDETVKQQKSVEAASEQLLTKGCWSHGGVVDSKTQEATIK